MRLARQFTAAAAIASLLIACALAASTTAFAAQRAAKAKPEPQAPIDTCKDEVGLIMLASPMAPWKGAPLRVVFAAEKPLAGELSLIAPNGHVAATIEHTGMAVLLISGLPKSHRPRREPGRRYLCAMAHPRIAQRSSRAKSSCSSKPGGRPARRQGRVANRRTIGTARRKICTPPGSRHCSTRRSTRRRRGRRCMRCCAIRHATCSSIISACARIRRGSSFSRTAPTCLTSCAPISPSRWDCRSATRNARAATAARRRDAHSGGTS